MPLAEAKDAFLDSLSSFGHGYGNGTIDKSVEDSFPASDPASFQEPGPHTMDPEVAQVATKSRPICTSRWPRSTAMRSSCRTARS